LSTSTIHPEDLDGINEQYRNILSKVAEDAIPLTDSFGFTDRELNSALGKKDGNVYEALWERVQRNPINKGGISAVLRVSFFFFILMQAAIIHNIVLLGCSFGNTPSRRQYKIYYKLENLVLGNKNTISYP
jgi:hypothetical protein